MKLHEYRAADGWRWRLKARNGRIIADSGESYRQVSAPPVPLASKAGGDGRGVLP